MHSTERPVDYFVVQGAKPVGPILGRFGEHDISEIIVDNLGYHYRFVGAAPRTWDGKLDTASLEPGQFILMPGLVYQRDESTRVGWFSALWHTDPAR